MDVLASRFNKLSRFVLGFRAPLEIAVDVMVTPWDQVNLIYALSSLKRLTCLLCKIKMEGIVATPIQLNWLRKTWYSQIV